MLALEEIGLTGVSVGEEHGACRVVRSMDPKGFDMSRADEDSLNDLSPRLQLLAWPWVSLVGLDQNSDSGPLNCGDPTSTTSESLAQTDARPRTKVARIGQAKGGVNRVGPECIEMVVDSADESCLPANFSFVGDSLGQDGQVFLTPRAVSLTSMIAVLCS